MPHSPVETTRPQIDVYGLNSIKERLSYIDVMHGFSQNVLSINFTMRMKAIQRETQTIEKTINELDKEIEDVEREVRSDQAPHFNQATLLTEKILKIITLLQAMFDESILLRDNPQIHPSSNCFRILMTWLLANDTRDLGSRMNDIHIICKRHVHLELEDILSAADPGLSHNDVLRIINLLSINGQIMTRNLALKAHADATNAKSIIMHRYTAEIDTMSKICTEITVLMNQQEELLQNISFGSKEENKIAPACDLKNIQFHHDSWMDRENVLALTLVIFGVLCGIMIATWFFTR